MESWSTFRRVFTKLFSFQVMLVSLLAAYLWVLAWSRVGDPDIWWHMRHAEQLLETHQFPTQDQFSFTAGGWEWINHAWLSEIPFYLAWRAGGLAGLNLFWLGMIGLIFAGLLHFCWRASGNFNASVIASGFVALLTVVSFGPRTILFAYLCMVCLLNLLLRFQTRSRGPLWLIPPLMCLWINAHGSWPLGFVLFSIFFAGGLFNFSWGRIESVGWTMSELVRLIATGLASAAAVFVNPYGWLLVRYPLDMASKQKLNIEHIEEWMSVNFHEAHGKVTLILLLGLLLSTLIKKQRWRLTELGWLMFALYMGLTYVRFQFFLAIVAAPFLARALDFLPPYDRQADKPAMNLAIIGLVGYAIVAHYQPPKEQALVTSLAEKYPVHAISQLKALPPDARVLNDFLWGGYIIWNARDLKVFIDSRVDIFEYSGVFADYIDWMGAKNVEKTVHKYRINYVLSPTDGVITRFFERDAGWRIMYRDKTAVLFEKRGR